MYTTPRVVKRATHTLATCKYPAFPVPIPGVYIEVVYGTRGCPGVMGTCDYRPELICILITDVYSTLVGRAECISMGVLAVGWIVLLDFVTFGCG